MNEYDFFISLVEESLMSIETRYYNTQFDGFYAFRNHIRNLGVFHGETFFRHTERGFAYELYHQLRKRVDKHSEGSEFFSEHTLQGEIKKMNAEPILKFFNYELDASYVPDLLFHVPTKDANAFVIEIKAQPELEDIEVLDDLEKLHRFMVGVHYWKSIFLAVNISPDSIENIIIRNRDKIVRFFGHRMDDCNIIVKQHPNEVPAYNKKLSLILA